MVPFTRSVERAGTYEVDDALLRVTWTASDASRLSLVANLSAATLSGVALPAGERVRVAGDDASRRPGSELAPYEVLLTVERNTT